VSKRAVVVGINKYYDPKLAELHGAEKDAEEVRNQLVQFGGFSIPDDAFLTGPQATSLAIRKAISDLLYGADEQSVSLFYFSGHGFPDPYGDGYIATQDVECARPWVRGLRMKDLRELLLKSKGKQAGILILDCCYSGIAADGDKGGDENADLSRQFKDSEDEFAGSGKIIITSSGKDQRSREKCDCVHEITGGAPHWHGLFTYQLLEGLDGGAADNAVDGKVNLASLMKFVQQRMDKNAGPRFYTSSLDNADAIVILDASRVFTLKQPIETVREGLQNEDGPLSLRQLVTELAKVLATAPNLPEANELLKQVQNRINVHKDKWVQFLSDNTAKLIDMKVNPQILRERRDLVFKFSFDTLCKMDGPSLEGIDYLDQAERGLITTEEYCERLRSRPLKESPAPSVDRAPLGQAGALRSGLSA
jgi:Caspase domain